MKNFSILIAGFFLFSSCEKVIEPKDLPEQDLRLVLNAVIQNDSVFSAYLSSSKSIISGKDYKTIDKSYCAVYEDGKFLEQLTFYTKGKYEGTKKPVAGRTYEFVARASGFEEVSGKTEFPVLPVLVSAIAYDTVQSVFMVSGPKGKPFENVFGGMKFKIGLKESSGIRDYYQLTPILVLVDSFGTPLKMLSTYLQENNSSGDNVTSSFVTSESIVSTDAEGVIAGAKVFDVYFSSNSSLIDFPTAAGIDIYVIASRLSEDYYKYLQTGFKQAFTAGSFFAEPTFVYSNCSNGMGVVGAKTNEFYFIKSTLFKR